jgi:formyl-CoA transferase
MAASARGRQVALETEIGSDGGARRPIARRDGDHRQPLLARGGDALHRHHARRDCPARDVAALNTQSNEMPETSAEETTSPTGAVRGPLNGLRVLELGHFIAGPFAARLLADLGAEVIKVEPPRGGDPARGWGEAVDGKSLWWSVHARNKKCVTLDLKTAEGRDIALRLTAKCDAVIENFRPGQLDRWGLGPDVLQAANPQCIVVHISGFGQNGPYRDRVAFGVIGEAIGGIRYLTGYPKEVTDLPPVRTGVSLADSVAGLYSVIGLLAALQERGRTGRGRVVDVALYESIFSLMEGCLTEYGRLGRVRQPAGAALPTVAPSNTYRCRDGGWICIAGNSEPIFARLMKVIGRADLVDDDRYRTNRARVANAADLDREIGTWAARLNAAEAEAQLDGAEVPASRIYTIRDCAEDPHFQTRGMIRNVADPALGELLHPGVVPRFEGEAAGGIGWPGPALGAYNQEVYGRLLGLSTEDVAQLGEAGIV